MALPGFLLRKLYRRGSLRVMNDGEFALTLQNPLGKATITAPPHIVANGVLCRPEEMEADGVEVTAITPENPFVFDKGETLDIRFPGHLLKWNFIHILALTEEFGELEILIEDEPAASCELPEEGFLEEE